MENEEKYVRRTQKDYTLSFKLSVVNEVECGSLTLTQISLKYGIQGVSRPDPTKDQVQFHLFARSLSRIAILAPSHLGLPYPHFHFQER